MASLHEIKIEKAIDDLDHILEKVEAAAQSSFDLIHHRFESLIHGLRLRELELCDKLNRRLSKIQLEVASKWKELSQHLSMIRSCDPYVIDEKNVEESCESLSGSYDGIEYCVRVSFPPDFLREAAAYGTFNDQLGDDISGKTFLADGSFDSVLSASYRTTLHSPGLTNCEDYYKKGDRTIAELLTEDLIEKDVVDNLDQLSAVTPTGFERMAENPCINQSIDPGDDPARRPDEKIKDRLEYTDERTSENSSSIRNLRQPRASSAQNSSYSCIIERILPWSVEITGATGVTSSSINGFYDPLECKMGSMSAYQKRGDPDKWLQYDSQKQAWYFTALSTHGDEEAWARAPCAPGGHPQSCTGAWQLCDYSSQGNSSKTAGSSSSMRDGIDDIMLGSFSGIPTVQQSISSNVAEAGEQPGGELWTRSYRGAVNEHPVEFPSFITGNLASAARGNATWNSTSVVEMENWIAAPSISVAVVAISLHLRGARGRFAAAVNGIYDPTSEWSGGQILFKKRELSTCDSIAAAGGGGGGGGGKHCRDSAQGKIGGDSRRPRTDCDQGEGGEAEGGDCKWMEYNPKARAWQVKPSSALGKDECWAFLENRSLVAPPQLLLGDIWHLHSGQGWILVPEMRLLPVATPVRLKGAVGPNAAAINGEYEPTEELCCGMPVYKKRGGVAERHKWLEFYESDYKGGRQLEKGTTSARLNASGATVIRKWVVKATSQKRTEHGWASVTCSGVGAPSALPPLPEECVGVWRVFDGRGMHAQPSLTVQSLG